MATTFAHTSLNRGSSAHGLLDEIINWFRGWIEIHRTENELAELSPHQLADIGLVGPNLPQEYRHALLHGHRLG